MYIPDEDWDALINHIADLEKTFQTINERQVIVNTNLIHGVLNVLINMQDSPLPVAKPTEVIPKHRRIRGHYGKNSFTFRDIPRGIRKRKDWINGLVECIKKANEYGSSGVRFLHINPIKATKNGKWTTHIDIDYARD